MVMAGSTLFRQHRASALATSAAPRSAAIRRKKVHSVVGLGVMSACCGRGYVCVDPTRQTKIGATSQFGSIISGQKSVDGLLDHFATLISGLEKEGAPGTGRVERRLGTVQQLPKQRQPQSQHGSLVENGRQHGRRNPTEHEH